MNNIWGKSDIGSTDGSPAINKSNVYLADGDMYITTTKDHHIYLNFKKINTNDDGSGDLVINKNCENCNVQIATGDLSVNDGDVSAKNATFSEDLTTLENITSPCLQTSTTGFNTGTTTTYYSTDYGEQFENITYYGLGDIVYNVTGGNSMTPLSSPLYSTSAATQYGAGAYTVAVDVPANYAADVIVSIKSDVKVTFDWVNNAGSITYTTDNRPISSVPTALTPGTWYPITSTDLLIYDNHTGSFGLYEGSVFFQWVAGNSGQTSTTRIITQPSPGAGSNDAYFSNGIYNFRFTAPIQALATTYRLYIGAYTQIFRKDPALGGPSSLVTFTQSAALNYNVESVSYTVQQTNVAVPDNTTLGMTLVNAFSYNTLLPRFMTSWFAVIPATTYVITHNLNMNPVYPVRFSILWSQTTGTYPMVDVTADYASSYVAQITNSNQMTFISGSRVAYPLGVTKTTGYWKISFF